MKCWKLYTNLLQIQFKVWTPQDTIFKVHTKYTCIILKLSLYWLSEFAHLKYIKAVTHISPFININILFFQNTTLVVRIAKFYFFYGKHFFHIFLITLSINKGIYTLMTFSIPYNIWYFSYQIFRLKSNIFRN